MGLIKKHYKLYVFSLVIILFIIWLLAINLGSIKVSPLELFKGLFIEYNQDVASIVNIRFPRTIITIVAGSALGLSGLLFQLVLKNDLADPGIIGISSAANFCGTIIISFIPSLYIYKPIIAFIGGILCFLIIYGLSLQKRGSILSIILIGVAINYILEGFNSIINSSNATITSSVTTTFTTFNDVISQCIYTIPFLIISLFLVKICTLLTLDDKTLLSLGVDSSLYRFLLASMAVMLCSISVAYLGVISFIALLVPHFSRALIGNDYKWLIPSTMILGAIFLLASDTIGRLIIAPIEIAPSIIMAIIGGPVFIYIYRKKVKNEIK